MVSAGQMWYSWILGYLKVAAPPKGWAGSGWHGPSRSGITLASPRQSHRTQSHAGPPDWTAHAADGPGGGLDRDRGAAAAAAMSCRRLPGVPASAPSNSHPVLGETGPRVSRCPDLVALPVSPAGLRSPSSIPSTTLKNPWKWLGMERGRPGGEGCIGWNLLLGMGPTTYPPLPRSPPRFIEGANPMRQGRAAARVSHSLQPFRAIAYWTRPLY